MPLKEVQIGQLACLVDDSCAQPAAAVVLAHGYAMEAHQLAPLACAMRLPATLYFPQGLHAAAPGGRCWWQVDEERRKAAIAAAPRDLHESYPEGRDLARSALLELMRHVRSAHPGRPLVLAGFSQGGMLACDTLLHEKVTAEGLILLSSSRLAMSEWRPRLERLRGLPVLVAHGTHDPDLAFSAGEGLRDELSSAGANVTWLSFEGGHETPLTVWRSVKRLVLQIALRSRGG